MLHHHDGISALGQRRTRHDLAARSRSHRYTGGLAGTRLPNDLKNSGRLGDVLMANGKAVANRFIKSRIVGVRKDILAKHSSETRLERHSFDGHTIRPGVLGRSRERQFQSSLD
jgi:hypothetical protein